MPFGFADMNLPLVFTRIKNALISTANTKNHDEGGAISHRAPTWGESREAWESATTPPPELPLRPIIWGYLAADHQEFSYPDSWIFTWPTHHKKWSVEEGSMCGNCRMASVPIGR